MVSLPRYCTEVSRGLCLESLDPSLAWLRPSATGFPSPKSPVSPPPWQESSAADLSHLCAYYYRLIKTVLSCSGNVPELSEAPYQHCLSHGQVCVCHGAWPPWDRGKLKGSSPQLRASAGSAFVAPST